MQSEPPVTEVLLEVVTYDPRRRLGFMRAVDAAFPGRVHFALAMLPEDFKRPLVERSRPLNARPLEGDAFKALLRELRRDVVGSRFMARIRVGGDGRRRLVPRSLTTAPRAMRTA